LISKQNLNFTTLLPIIRRLHAEGFLAPTKINFIHYLGNNTILNVIQANNKNTSDIFMTKQ